MFTSWWLRREKRRLVQALNELNSRFNLDAILEDLNIEDNDEDLESAAPAPLLEQAEDSDDEASEERRELEAYGEAMYKMITGQVSMVQNRVVTIMPGNWSVSLDQVNHSFIPIVGDMVQLKTICGIDRDCSDLSGKILRFDKLSPLRCRVVQGHISLMDDVQLYGEITMIQEEPNMPSEVCCFTLDKCEPGYIPCINDLVSMECIESTQRISNNEGTQRYLQWRALLVVCVNSANNELKRCREEQQLLQDTSVISIKKYSHLGRLEINTTKTLKVVIRNKGHTPLKVAAIYPHPRLCPRPQFTLLECPQLPFALAPQTEQVVVFLCTARNLGVSQDLMVYALEGGTCVGRYLHVDVVSQYCPKEAKPTSDRWRYQTKNKSEPFIPHFENEEALIINAPRTSGPLDPFRRRLPAYPVPKDAMRLAMSCINCRGHKAVYQALVYHFPSLREEASIKNYISRWQYLLHIEEAEITVDLQRFEMKEAQLQPVTDADYTNLCVLQVPGLQENRPSVVLNDRVRVQNTKGGLTYEGLVNKVMQCQVQLLFNQRFERPGPTDTYHVSFTISRNSFRRLHAAVDAAVKCLGPQILFPPSNIPLRQPQLLLEYGENENAPATGPSGDEGSDRMIPGSSSLQQRVNSLHQNAGRKKRITFFNKHLNVSQQRAVYNVLLGKARPVPYIIYGPPGTGKTITLVELILQLHINIPDSRIIVATPSNSAADLLAERLLNSNLLIPGAMVRLVAVSYEDHVPLPLIPYMRVLRHLGELQVQSHAYERIIVGTCGTLGKLVQDSQAATLNFTHILLDEAGQTTEPESMLVAALLGKPKQIVLAGDPMQLGPVVQGRASETGGLGISLMSRLLGSGPYIRDPESYPQTQGYNPNTVTMLVQNYRSLPEILALPGLLFYNSELVATVSPHQGPEVSLLLAMKDDLPSRTDQNPPALVFHGVRGVSDRDPDSPSWFNAKELSQVAMYVATLYKKGLRPRDIGIISPYNKQVQKMRQLLVQADLAVPKVGSVEEFQGQERFVVIFSAVRSSEGGEEDNLGFLANPQRMNTAITRARALLVVVGDPHLLAQDRYWRSLLMDCIKRNAYQGCDLPAALVPQTA